jgi:hypothetical protein
MDTTPTLKRVITATLLAGGVAVAGLGLGTGTAQAGPLRWCPGDPPPNALLPTPGGGWAPGPVNPAWDTNICHDYTMRDNQVAEGIGCPLPDFQWFQCPPGTTPHSNMPLIPNR